MEAKELRIGNLVNEKWWDTTIGEYEYSLVIVSAIYPTHIRCQDDHAYDFEDCQPIPLTEEWLFELGFKKEGESNFYKKNINQKGRIWINIRVDGGVGCEIGTLAGYSAGFVDCKHIHQLQNLYFALTGEELTLNK
jgi:hypothetical protein